MHGKRLGILTFPISEAGTIPLSQLIDILYMGAEKLYLLTGGRGYDRFKDDSRVMAYDIHHAAGKGRLKRARQYLRTQMEMAYRMVKLSDEVDEWIFFIGGDGLFIPMMAMRLMGKPATLTFAGSNYNSYASTNDAFSEQMRLLTNINCALATRVVLYTPRLTEEYGLERCKHKIIIAHRHFVDTGTFRRTRALGERGPLIGYVGRLSEEKGVRRLVEGFAQMSDRTSELMIIGDGPLREELEALVDASGLSGRVHWAGWVPHDELGERLNQLHLLVLPSYTEGLPNVMLEAMACGTPVLAPKVGSIPDVLEDGSTGYLMDDNDAATICKSMQRALNDETLDEIAEKGMHMVMEKFNFRSSAVLWKSILEGSSGTR